MRVLWWPSVCAKLNEEADGATRRDGRCFNIRSYSLVIMQVRAVVSLRQTTVVSTKKCKLREACLSTQYASVNYDKNRSLYSAVLLYLSYRTCNNARLLEPKLRYQFSYLLLKILVLCHFTFFVASLPSILRPPTFGSCRYYFCFFST